VLERDAACGDLEAAVRLRVERERAAIYVYLPVLCSEIDGANRWLKTAMLLGHTHRLLLEALFGSVEIGPFVVDPQVTQTLYNEMVRMAGVMGWGHGLRGYRNLA
jgi:hypothetical protein